MATVEGTKLDKILDKIQKLLSMADHPNTPEHEADTARAKAESLMMEYRIEESELHTGEEGVSSLGIETKKVDICEANNEFKDQYFALFYWVAVHCGLRSASKYEVNPEDGKLWISAIVVGYESDIRFARLMYLNTRLQFAAKLEPSKDSSLSDMENVYNMRKAGMEYNRIALAMYGQEKGDGVQRRAQALYKKACAAKGEDSKDITNGSSAKTYRHSFALYFVDEIYGRLSRMRAASGVNGSGEIVLASRKENVDEAFYQQFPHLRPKPAGEYGTTTRTTKVRTRAYKAPKISAAGAAAGRKAAADVDFSRMQTEPRRRVN